MLNTDAGCLSSQRWGTSSEDARLQPACLSVPGAVTVTFLTAWLRVLVISSWHWAFHCPIRSPPHRPILSPPLSWSSVLFSTFLVKASSHPRVGAPLPTPPPTCTLVSELLEAERQPCNAPRPTCPRAPPTAVLGGTRLFSHTPGPPRPAPPLHPPCPADPSMPIWGPPLLRSVRVDVTAPFSLLCLTPPPLCHHSRLQSRGLQPPLHMEMAREAVEHPEAAPSPEHLLYAVWSLSLIHI